MNSAPQTISRPEQTRADPLTLAAGGSGPGLLAVAGELMAAVTHTHPSVHARVGGTRVYCSLTVEIRVRGMPPTHTPW